jgi:anti-sigma B factor antagonist
MLAPGNPFMPNEAASLLTLDVEQTGDVATVRCHGRLIAGTSEILYSRVSQLIPNSKRIVLDLTDLAYADSMGLGSLVRLYVSCRSRGCSLELIHLGKRLIELLGVTHLLKVFTIIGENGVPMKF